MFCFIANNCIQRQTQPKQSRPLTQVVVTDVTCSASLLTTVYRGRHSQNSRTLTQVVVTDVTSSASLLTTVFRCRHSQNRAEQ